MSWEREFDEPIPLPNGKTLVTLADARAYILKLKQIDQNSDRWQTAAQALLLVADRNGPTMFARIGLMVALPPPGERVCNPDAKSHHWAKRNLKRDE
jgi:hypothetical protein